MQNTRIQLLGNPSGYLETDNNTIVPLTFAISDIKDLSKRKGTFSKSIQIPGTKNNNKLLNNYFDVNVLAGTFDINKIVKCAIIQDGIIILDNAVMQLVSVNKTETNSMSEDSHTYTILIKDTTSDLFGKISNKKLQDIDLTFGDHIYTAENVITSFSNTVEDGYKYVMPYNAEVEDDINFNLTEFTPAIYARKYFDKIFSDAGYAYNWPSANDNDIQFDKLLIPYNGDVPVYTNEPATDYVVEAEINDIRTSTNTYNAGSSTYLQYGIRTFPSLAIGNQLNNDVLLTGWTETQDDYNLFNPTVGTYVPPAAFPSSTNNVRFKFRAEYIIRVRNTSTSARQLTYNGLPDNARRLTLKPNINVTFGFNNVGTFNLAGSQAPQLNDTYIVAGSATTILGSGVSEGEFIINNVEPNGAPFLLTKQLEIDPSTLLGYYSWNDVGSSTKRTDVFFDYILKGIYVEIMPLISGEYGYNVPIFLNNFIPKDIKQSDFLKGIFTMFNLYVDIDDENQTLLNIYKRDDYYDSGKIEDWTYKLAKEKPQDIKFLPEISNKKLLLTYKEDKDWANTAYKTNVGEIYGQALFTFDNEFVQDESKIEVLFSPTPFAYSSDLDAVLPMWNGTAPKTNIRILYDGGEYGCNPYRIWNYPTETSNDPSIVDNNTYPFIAHWDKPINPTFDLNFLPPKYYFRTDNFGSNTNNNIFNLHWRRTLYQINNGRLLTAYFNLTANDIQKMKLNDKIRINNSWWNINKISDYNANSNDLTKVELISIDDELKIDYVPTESLRVSQTSPLLLGINNLIKDNVRTKNKIYSEGIVEINGFNNTLYAASKLNLITGNNNLTNNNGLIIGSQNDLSSNSIIIGGGNNVGIDSNNIIIGNSNTVDNNLSSVLIVGDNISATTANSIYTDNLYITEGIGTINGIPIETFLSGNTNTFLTGGTYNNGTGTLTLTQNNLGPTINVTGFTTGGGTFTGGTVTGPTTFTAGLTANTISATTYLNLPLDVTVTGGTYSSGTLTLNSNNGSSFNVTGFQTTDIFTTGGTYNNTTGTATFTNNNGGTFNVSGFNTGYTLTSSAISSALGYTPVSADTFTTGGTYNAGTLTLNNNNGSSFDVTGFPTSGGTDWSGGTNYVIIKATGTPTQNGTALFNAYTAASGSTSSRFTIILMPGYYSYSTQFTMNKQYVDITSVNGERNVFFQVPISITVNDVRLTGIDAGTNAISMAVISNPLMIIKNCKGGTLSFNSILNANNGTFIDCETTGINSFGFNSASVGGTYINCKATTEAFNYTGLNNNTGYYRDCEAGNNAFASSLSAGDAAGTFLNCIAGNNSFGYSNSAISGFFFNCKGQTASFGTNTVTNTGTYIDCVGNGNSFGSNLGATSLSARTNTGNYFNCKADTQSFGYNQNFNGIANNCIASTNSFGGGTVGQLTGKVYYGKLTAGTFQTVSSGGRTVYCIDGSDTPNNQ